jgi:hypothetical protein
MRHLGIEFGDLAGSEHPILVAENETYAAGQNVDPFVPVVRPRFRIDLAGRARLPVPRRPPTRRPPGPRPQRGDEAQIVRQWTNDLVYFTPPDTLTSSERTQLAARTVGVIEGTVEQLIIHNDQLRGVQLDDGCVVPCDALFVPPRFVPNNHLLVGLGCDMDGDGWITTDNTGRTTVPGVWAAGNVVDPRAQVITAAGAGSPAAIALNADLFDEEVRGASRPPPLKEARHDRT